MHVQKHLVLSNLKLVYSAFKANEKVDFSKFVQLRPRHCILAGASRTHFVCVCTTHQYVKLMIQGVKLSDIPGASLIRYCDCLAQVLCNPPLPSCY